MASVNNISRRRTHNLLLLSSLLNLRDTASPLTLLLDSLEQPATPLLKEYIRRAKLSKSNVTFVSFETFQRPEGVDTFISATRKNPQNIAKETTASFSPRADRASDVRRCLVIIDSINSLICRKAPDQQVNIAEYLSSLLSAASPKLHVSLIVVYHQDIPAPRGPNPYAPSPLSLLTYLATAIFTIHSFSHVLARKAAADRSMVTPVFGLAEEREGVIIGRQDSGGKKLVPEKSDGIVLEMEHRRKSGRGVVEWYFLPDASQYPVGHAREVVTLLDDHPLYRREEAAESLEGEGGPMSTFELGLTERQRRDRENVVLPYFDAQKGEGPGEGGRILYEMGEEDDFDEEEDEI